ncbi:hypothetical protein [Niabella ginsengisoli]|uniref:Uncharacterized protein n=1 Tax=Niabella ginsengisoli TaxID=522298 RepID=A0ABS9SRT2_9BACT|nr:hypothetical protein [Niabella ginsengisoli]MCH5600844.1 hypothetical protein [Niabella ginsengisoli]
MTTGLNYDQVIKSLTKSESDDFIQQVIILLTLVHEEIKKTTFNKSDFIFTQFDEGHILVTGVKN